MQADLTINHIPQSAIDTSEPKKIFRCEKVLRRVKTSQDQEDLLQGLLKIQKKVSEECEVSKNSISNNRNVTDSKQANKNSSKSIKLPKQSQSTSAISPITSKSQCNKSNRTTGSQCFSKPHEGYDISEEVNELRTESSSFEANYDSKDDQSGNSSSENSSDLDICNLDLDMKDESPNATMELPQQEQNAQLEKYQNQLEEYNYFQGLILQTIQESIEAVRRLPPYTFLNNIQQQTLLPGKQPEHQFTLILDLDETLVHCSLQPFAGFQEIIPVAHAEELIQIYVAYRPHLIQFLEQVSQHFEVVVFTASEKQYADIILNKIDPNNKYFSHRLYRSHCLQIKEQSYIKDLSQLGRDLSKTIIVDNSIFAFAYHIENGVPIPSFYGQSWDYELNILSSILKDLTSNFSRDVDVREQIVRTFRIMDKIYPNNLQSQAFESMNIQ